MKQQLSPDIGRGALACVPNAIPVAERAAHFALIQRLLSAAVAREDAPTGLFLTFEAERLEEIARFVVNERKCCPFLNFELIARGSTDRVTLRLTGPEGTGEFLKAEFAEVNTR